MTGNITASGTISEGGTLLTSKYLQLAGGNMTANANITLSGTGTFTGNGSGLTNIQYSNITGLPATFAPTMTDIYTKGETNTFIGNTSNYSLNISNILKANIDANNTTTNTAIGNTSNYALNISNIIATNYLLKSGGIITGNLDIEKANPIVSIKAQTEGQSSILYLSSLFNYTSALKTAIISEGLSAWGRSRLHFLFE